MAEGRIERRLAAILAADVAGVRFAADRAVLDLVIALSRPVEFGSRRSRRISARAR